MISNFFVLSPRGDTIIAKRYRIEGDASAHERSHTEAFFRKIKFWDDTDGGGSGTTPDGGSGSGETASGGASAEEGRASSSLSTGDAPPVFLMPDGLTYMHVKRNGLIFACNTARNVSAVTVIELLNTIARVFKDYCGTLSEEGIRKNFILLYELLDEMLDYGYPQVTRTLNLKSCVYNEAILVDPITNTSKMVNPKTASASAVHKPVISAVNANGRKSDASGQQKNEIFVDILERLNVLFSANGYVLNSTIDGCIQMKSYLAGSPQLRLALNEDLAIGKNNAHYGAPTVDDINFNEIVNLSEFETARTLSFVPPDGEFVVLNYRVTGDFTTPFRIIPSIEEVDSKKLEVTVLIRADMPTNHFGANVTVEIPLPKCTSVASCAVIASPGTGHTNAEFVRADGKILWTLKKIPGGSEQTMRAKVTLSQSCTTQIRREIGPINMSFEIPMFNVSQLQVRYLRIAENMVGYTPYRWVRYVTQSSSYVCRV
uniref:MHD domain-containing protein n=1 Tax=Pseudo-nitzschia australis TaxID=44445 RepID=A0A7S4ANY5_9STRA|mmetsp:Transcript_429/g.1067  ORF Transcript_429/g.1067 Transcript_429/m.1067 type:complete len:487 (+) Transcript_429:160-1620(+)